MKVYVYKMEGRSNWYCQWTDPVTRKKKTKSTGTTNKREAERFAGLLEAELRTGTWQDTSRVTWKEFRQRYESEVLSGLAKGTKLKGQAIFNLVEELINPDKLAALDASQISLLVEGLRKKELREATIKSHLSHLKAALRWGKRVKLLTQMPEIQMPKRTAAMKGRAITSEEFERILNKVPKVMGEDLAGSWEFLLRGLWWSGLRRNEALALHWEEGHLLSVDFTGEHPMIRIQPEGQKSGKEQLLPVAPEFEMLLLSVPEEQRTGFVFNPVRRHLTPERPKPLAVTLTIQDIARAAKVKVAIRKGKEVYAGPHDLRRSFGFRWAQRVMPATLQQLMRHEQISTTMQFYVGKNADLTAKALWAALPKEAREDFTNTFANTPSET